MYQSYLLFYFQEMINLKIRSESMEGYVHSIESFGTVDGPGIRFVVFLQGCPLRCKYCHNPDTWKTNTGKTKTVDEILQEYERKKDFYVKGGITVTGGEPLLQIDFVMELFKKCKEKGIHTCIDTSGITYLPENHEKMDALMQYTDLVMLDIKHIDSKEHKELTGVANEMILEFAQYLDQKEIPVWIRHVVVPTITQNDTYLYQLGRFIGTLHNVKALDVLPYHDMGKVKYDQLHMEYPLKDIEPLDKSEAVEARKVILKGIKDERKSMRL